MVGISLADVTKRFGDTVAVDRVSLEIAPGELFFLLGPSGCGKTTLLRMIAGFEAPDAGEIRFDGRPVDAVPPHRRNTALVFQSYALWPHMTVAQNVAYGLEERKVARAEKLDRVHAALRTVHMEPFADRMSNELSGGQQQRVALARALVIRPDAVLLDEPLSNLDARLRLEMRREIRRIHDETGITMVYVTHDQKESLSMADRMAVMSTGRVEQVGDPRSVYRSPTSRFVADFIGETNLIHGRLSAVEGAWATVTTPLGSFRARMGGAQARAGAAVVCMVRPECLRVGEPAAENRLQARVGRKVYLGEFEEMALETRARTLRAVCLNPGPDSPRTGEGVIASFAPADALILNDA